MRGDVDWSEASRVCCRDCGRRSVPMRAGVCVTCRAMRAEGLREAAKPGGAGDGDVGAWLLAAREVADRLGWPDPAEAAEREDWSGGRALAEARLLIACAAGGSDSVLMLGPKAAGRVAMAHLDGVLARFRARAEAGT